MKNSAAGAYHRFYNRLIIMGAEEEGEGRTGYDSKMPEAESHSCLENLRQFLSEKDAINPNEMLAYGAMVVLSAVSGS